MRNSPKPQPLHDKLITLITTTESKQWQDAPVFSPTFSSTMLNLNIENPASDATSMQGFGACFNELGWTSLQTMSEADRNAVIRELFDPTAGARFTYCRMPVGANDFATEAYSMTNRMATSNSSISVSTMTARYLSPSFR